MNIDRRKNNRHTTEPVDVILLRTPQNVEYLCSVQDLSRRGFRAEIIGGPARNVAAPDTQVAIVECPPKLADLLNRMQGRIAWATPEAMGVEFDHDMADDESTLERKVTTRNLGSWSAWDV